MFVSFFPRPKMFFWSLVVWTALCVGFWYAGGAALGASVGLGGTPSPEQAGQVSIFWSGAFLWFYLYFTIATLLFALFWQLYRATSLDALVDSRFGADPVHDLFSGPGVGRGQRLVRTVLRSRPGRARQDPACHASRILRPAYHLRRDRLRRGRRRRVHALLHEPLDLPLAQRDERLLHDPLVESCALSKAPRSVCRKTRCGSPPRWRASAPTSFSRS